MITKPSIDSLTELAGNKYALCCVISKRAKQLNEAQKRDEISTDVKTISYAATEFVDGRTEIK
jgi:DNA-directed RNA polymerase omega subunit